MIGMRVCFVSLLNYVKLFKNLVSPCFKLGICLYSSNVQLSQIFILC